MPPRAGHRLQATFGVLAAALVVTAGVATAGGPDAGVLLLLAPAILLGLALLAGRYPGEATLSRWRAAFVTRAPRAARLTAPVGRRRVSVAPHGGALLASHMGRRGPPRARLAVV